MQISLKKLSNLFHQDIDLELLKDFFIEAFSSKNELLMVAHAFFSWKYHKKKIEFQLPISPKGICPLYSSYYFNWPALPYLQEHRFLAQMLYSLGTLSRQEHLILQSEKMFSWQDKWVDHRQKFLPLFAQKEYLEDFSSSQSVEGLCYDEDFHIVLQKTRETTIAITSSGCKSSIGSFLHNEIGIVAFAPYLLEQGSFGIVTLPNAVPAFAKRLDGFSFQFTAQCAKKGTPVLPDLDDSEASNLFFSFNTHCLKNHLECEFSLAYCLEQKFAFYFYAKAKRCRVKDSHILHSQSFDHYLGPSQKIELLGQTSSICLECSPCQMEIVPLGENFCKSDFLVIYIFNQNRGNFTFYTKN